MVDGLFFLTMGRRVGQGGADVSQLQDCGSVACGVGGGMSSWPGLEHGLGRMEVVLLSFISNHSCAKTCSCTYLSTNSF